MKKVENGSKKNVILFLLLVAYSAMIYMFNGQEENIRYVHIMYVGLVLYLIIYTFRVRSGLLEFTKPCRLMLLYLVFSTISLVWSPMRDTSFSRLVTVGLLFVLCVLINNYADKITMSKYIIISIIVGGLCEALYCIYSYGVNTLISFLTTGTRLNDVMINNVNTLSNTLVVAIVTTLAVILLNRKYWLTIMLIPEIFVLMTFSSRTAFIALAISTMIVFTIYLKLNKSERYPEYNFICFVLIVFFTVIIYKAIYGESTIMSRFDSLISFFSGNGEGKASSLADRSNFVKLGFLEFLEFPIGGRGFGCAGYVLKSAYGYFTYLHNNYIEILASGGLIGTGLYYGVYFYLVKRHAVIIKKNYSIVPIISFATLCCEMITQIGIVTYYSKVTWLCMTLWIMVVEMDYKDY